MAGEQLRGCVVSYHPRIAHVISGHVMWRSCSVVSCLSCHLCYVLSYHVMSCHVVSCRFMLCHVVSCRVLFCRVATCRVAKRGYNTLTPRTFTPLTLLACAQLTLTPLTLRTIYNMVPRPDCHHNCSDSKVVMCFSGAFFESICLASRSLEETH